MYKSTDSQGYLINPNDGGTTWWHFTEVPDLEFSLGQYQSFFAGSRHVHFDTGEFDDYDYRLEVRIKLKPDCGIFDTKDLFGEIPSSIDEDLYDVIGDVSHTKVHDVLHYEPEIIPGNVLEFFKRVPKSPLLDGLSVADLVSLYLKEYASVQHFLEENDEKLGPHIAGWFEVERFGGYENIGLFMDGVFPNACSGAEIEVIRRRDLRENPLSGKAPTFTSDAQGYLRNPLSDSGVSWWHVTSPYTRNIERYGFTTPSYFASDIDTLCELADTLNRPDPISLYDVKLRIRPENLICPQTIFKDWIQSFEKTAEDEDGREFDDEADRPNPWFSSPEFLETLTPLGKRFYDEIASASNVYSPASVMSMVCGCKYIIFDILKNMGMFSPFEGWCLENNIYGWAEAEFNQGSWVLDNSEMWTPEGGFNIGVWETSRVEITEVMPDILECNDTNYYTVGEKIGRRNPMLIAPAYVAMYHGTDRPIEKLDRDSEIFLAPTRDQVTDSAPDYKEVRYIYEVLVPGDLVIFDPQSVFKDRSEAEANALALGVEDLDGKTSGISQKAARMYFNNNGSYTEIGLGIVRAFGYTFPMTHLDRFLQQFVCSQMGYIGSKSRKQIKHLQSLGFQAYLEQDACNVLPGVYDYDLCVFDQRLCKLGRAIAINPKP